MLCLSAQRSGRNQTRVRIAVLCSSTANIYESLDRREWVLRVMVLFEFAVELLVIRDRVTYSRQKRLLNHSTAMSKYKGISAEYSNVYVHTKSTKTNSNKFTLWILLPLSIYTCSLKKTTDLSATTIALFWNCPSIRQHLQKVKTFKKFNNIKSYQDNNTFLCIIWSHLTLLNALFWKGRREYSSIFVLWLIYDVVCV